MDNTPQIQWSTSRFKNAALEQAYLDDSWKSVRLQTALTLIGFSLAWLLSLSVDITYLRGTGYFVPVAGSRGLAGASGVLIGLWMLVFRPNGPHGFPKILVYIWMALSVLAAVTVSWSYPFTESTVAEQTDILLFNCYWMSLQVLGLGIALSAWRIGVFLSAIIYIGAYIAQAVYWAPAVGYLLVGQIIVVTVASIFGIILSFLFARRARQRFAMTKLYEEASVAAETAQQFSTFLLAATGHDIRQPIFALTLNASMLEDLIEDQDWEQAARVAKRQREALTGVSGLISSVLELSQLDTQRRSVAPEPLALSDVIETVSRPIQPIASDKNIDLRLMKTSLSVEADRGIVEHIVANLVANAVSHADADRVLIGARCQGEFVDLFVIDDGKGLSDVPRTLTVADIQPGKTRQASRGLGVEIMFRLADKAGLDLTLKSEPGRGVAARLRCPAHIPGQK